MKQRHTFPSLMSATSYLRKEGFKPDQENPREWHRIKDHEKQTARFLHVNPNGGGTKVEVMPAKLR